MGKKVVDYILAKLEEFFGRILVVHRGYDENLVGKGFKSVRYSANMWKIILLGKDKTKNAKLIEQVQQRLLEDCQNKVRANIRKAKKKLKDKGEDE